MRINQLLYLLKFITKFEMLIYYRLEVLMTLKEKLGKKIKEYRQLQGISQEELAEQLDISQQTLSKIECGKNFLTSETLERISSVLGVNTYELFMFEEYNTQAEMLVEIEKYISIIRSNPQKLAFVKNMVKEVAKL